MVSREGEEAEYHESMSNSSTPPRMGSIKKSSHDPLQNRLSSESYQSSNNGNGQILGNFHQLTLEANKLFKNSTNNSVSINLNMEEAKQDSEENLSRVPPILENNIGKNKYHTSMIKSKIL